MENQNPISQLGEIVQKLYGKNIETKVVSKSGPDHIPTISVCITLPNGNEYFAEGSNKKMAKQKAAVNALIAEKLL